MLPWDWDLDVQLHHNTLAMLGQQYNQTMHKYRSADGTVEREYLLDVNPWIWQRVRGDGKNVIDARWIDIRNGLFIDITGITETDPTNAPGILNCKNWHRYHYDDIWPLRDTTFEGVPAKIPYNFDAILVKEYNTKALTVTEFQGCVSLSLSLSLSLPLAFLLWISNPVEQPPVERLDEGLGEGDGRAERCAGGPGPGAAARTRRLLDRRLLPQYLPAGTLLGMTAAISSEAMNGWGDRACAQALSCISCTMLMAFEFPSSLILSLFSLFTSCFPHDLASIGASGLIRIIRLWACALRWAVFIELGVCGT